MFVVIETNGATHIVINVAHQDAERALPALAGMLEGNAKFVRKDWRDATAVTPKMTIELGASYIVGTQSEGDAEFVIVAPEVPETLRNGLLPATPELITSNRKAIDVLGKKLSDANAELTVLRNQLATAKQQLEEAQAASAD